MSDQQALSLNQFQRKFASEEACHLQKGHPLYLKMEVIPDVKGETIVEFANRTIAPGSVISSDAYKSYKALAEAELGVST